MGHTALVLGDQLMRDNPALAGAERVLFVESRASLRGVTRRAAPGVGGRSPTGIHRRRVHLVLSALRHFARELREAGEVEVVERRGVATLAEGLEGFDDVVCAEPNAWPARRGLARLGVRFVRSNQFLTHPDEFAAWAQDRRRLVMEDFYRWQRVRLGVLVDEDGKPVGGRWNFDRENRRPPTRAPRAPDPWRPEEDEVDAEVRRDLDALDVELWGEDGPRRFAATPAEAQRALRSFVEDRLAAFGPWQDAMTDERVLFHSLLSAPMNLGLLEPMEVVRAVEAADVPLQSKEGYLRQVIGWREYVWGMYWLRRERWPERNALAAQRDLPAAFWDARSGWNCLDSVVDGVRRDGYAHHIQRLMVLGNTMLLAGVEPWQGVRWFQGAFVDGAEWVMAPNAAGMAMHADGGEMFTKPYAGGGNYVNRMSRYCRDCRFEPHVRRGPRACPVTALYWDFMARHRDRLAGNRRMRGTIRALDAMDHEELRVLRDRARRAVEELDGGWEGAQDDRRAADRG